MSGLSLLHRLVKLIPVPSNSAYVLQPSLIEYQNHEGLVWNAFPLAFYVVFGGRFKDYQSLENLPYGHSQHPLEGPWPSYQEQLS